MGYSNYRKMRQVTQKFGLRSELAELFSDITPVAPSAWLSQTLNKAKQMPLTNEKNKSERIVSPILLEVALAYPEQITLFSGEDLNISPQDDLSGPCDFFFALQKPSIVLDRPIVSLVEAKDEDIEWGLAQCAAQLIGAKRYNEAEGNDTPVLYGCATDGREWLFLRFADKTIFVDREPLLELPKVLGVWHVVLSEFIV